MDDSGAKRGYEADDCSDNYDQPKRRRGGGGEDGNCDLRFLVASKNVGAIIGKGGANIKRLRQDYKASVTILDSTTPERVLTIGAEMSSAMECVLDVIPKLEDSSKNNTEDGEFDCEMKLLVHQSQAGCVIGRGGVNIKELRQETGAKIRVFSQCCPDSTERVVAIEGKPKVVVDCIEKIYELLKTAPPKGPSHPYDPACWDEFMVAEYGGFTTSEGGRNTGGPRGGQRDMGGMRGERFGRDFGGDRQGMRRDGGGMRSRMDGGSYGGGDDNTGGYGQRNRGYGGGMGGRNQSNNRRGFGGDGGYGGDSGYGGDGGYGGSGGYGGNDGYGGNSGYKGEGGYGRNKGYDNSGYGNFGGGSGYY